MRIGFSNAFFRVVFVVIAGVIAFLLGQSSNRVSGWTSLQRTNRGHPDPSDAKMVSGLQNSAMARSAVDSSKPDKEILQLIAKGPKLGLAELAKLQPGTRTQEAYKKAFGTWVHDPAQAPEVAAMAYELTDGLNRPIAIQSVMVSWVVKDANAALDWASSLVATDAEPLKDALISLSNEGGNPQLAAQYVDDFQDSSARNEAIQTIAQSWALGFMGGGNPDPAAVLDWLDQVATGDTYDTNATYILNNLAQNNPATAASLLDDVTEPAVREAAIANLASSWGKTDPQSALNWAQSLQDSDAASALNLIITSWSQTNPAAAVAYVQASSDPAAFLSTAPALAQALAASNPQAALAFSSSLPDGDAKNQALNNALVTMAKSDFTSAWTYAASLPATDNPADIMGNLVGTLATKDPVQAAGLLQQFPEGPAQLNATSSVAATWALLDFHAFSQWANDLPTGSEHDAAVSAALNAAQSAKLPAPERAAFVEMLTQNLSGAVKNAGE